MSFEAEDKVVDQYVEVKETQDTDELVTTLIKKYFIKGNRFEEARSWKSVIADKAKLKEINEEIRKASKNNPSANIVRIPHNEDWVNESAAKPAHASDDQQYHYDRTVSYCNATKMMLDNIEDVKVCRNEWITFMSKRFISDLKNKRANHNVLSMALSDYIEFILLPNKFIHTNTNSTPAPSYSTVEKAYASRHEVVDYLQDEAPAVLQEKYLLNFFCQTGTVGAKTDEIIVTDNHILFVPEKKSGWGAGDFGCIPISQISSVAVGSEVHTEYQGITSKTMNFWTLTFVTTQYTEFTRWLYLGKNEAEMNKNRPIHGKTLDRLSEFVTLTQGDSFQSSGGYTTSLGVGFWV